MGPITYKEIAIDFLTQASIGNSREVFKKYVGDDFLHHNIHFKGDADTLMLAMEENARKFPGKRFEIKRALQDGNLVVVHSHVKPNPNEPGAAVVHIFRFEKNSIVELWDMSQAVPENSINENGMF